MSDRRMTSRLNDIADEIATSRNLVEAGWMAVQFLPAEDCRGLCQLLALVGDKLTESITTLTAASKEARTIGEEADV